MSFEGRSAHPDFVTQNSDPRFMSPFVFGTRKASKLSSTVTDIT